MDADPDAVAERLYRIPPEDFVAARDEAVGRFRASGDRAAAREVAAYKRPTRAAWLTNLLVTSAPDEVEGLLSLAGPLADAQRSLDGPALRQVSAQRNRLLGTLARQAAELGRDAGQRVDSGLEREVREVLESALADDELAARVRSGRLVRFERHSGFGTFGADGEGGGATDDGSGAAGRGGAGDRSGTTGGKSGAARTADLDRKRAATERHAREHETAERRERARETAERRERERREQAVADAEDRVERARLAAHDAARERDGARERADTAAGQRDDAHRRVEELRSELEHTRTAATEADRTLKSAEREATEAARRARRAGTEVSRAEQALEDARDS